MSVLRILRKWLSHSRIVDLCSTSDAQPWRLYSHILLLYISVEFIHVNCNETSPSYPSWNMMEGFLPETQCTILDHYQVLAEVETKCCKILSYCSSVMQKILNYGLL